MWLGWRYPGRKEPADLRDHGCSLRNRPRNPTGLNIDDTGINEAATRLLGLEGVSVIKVKDDGSGGSTVYVVAAEDSARACPSCGVFATRLKDYRTTRPQAPALRRASGEYPVAQGALALHRTRVRARLVHRGDRPGTRPDADHPGAAPGGGGRGLRRRPHRRAGRPRPGPELADHAAMLRGLRREGPARDAAGDLGDRDRRDPAGQAGMEAEPGHAEVGARRGRLAHRLRRRDRRAAACSARSRAATPPRSPTG